MFPEGFIYRSEGMNTYLSHSVCSKYYTSCPEHHKVKTPDIIFRFGWQKKPVCHQFSDCFPPCSLAGGWHNPECPSLPVGSLLVFLYCISSSRYPFPVFFLNLQFSIAGELWRYDCFLWRLFQKPALCFPRNDQPRGNVTSSFLWCICSAGRHFLLWGSAHWEKWCLESPRKPDNFTKCSNYSDYVVKVLRHNSFIFVIKYSGGGIKAKPQEQLAESLMRHNQHNRIG